MALHACVCACILLITLVAGAACATMATSLYEGLITLTTNGDLALTPPPGKTVVLGGMDILAVHADINGHLDTLETRLGLFPTPFINRTVPVEAFCWCPTTTGCTPAIRFASGNVTCCASDTSLQSCHWIRTHSSTAAGDITACHKVLVEGGPRNATFPIHGFNTVEVGKLLPYPCPYLWGYTCCHEIPDMRSSMFTPHLL